MDDDDYLVENALNVINQKVLQFPEQNWFAFDVYSNSPDVRQNNQYKHEYQQLSYAQYRNLGMYDDHFVWKKESCQRFRYPDKYFKNGYEHIYYFDLPFNMVLLPERVKVIEYYDDGLTKSEHCNIIHTFSHIIKHIALRPKEKVYYIWLYNWFEKKTFIGRIFIYLPKRFLEELIRMFKRIGRSIRKKLNKLVK